MASLGRPRSRQEAAGFDFLRMRFFVPGAAGSRGEMGRKKPRCWPMPGSRDVAGARPGGAGARPGGGAPVARPPRFVITSSRHAARYGVGFLAQAKPSVPCVAAGGHAAAVSGQSPAARLHGVPASGCARARADRARGVRSHLWGCSGVALVAQTLRRSVASSMPVICAREADGGR